MDKKEYNKAYYWKNPEYHRNRVKKYHQENKEERNKKKREWYYSDAGKAYRKRTKEERRIKDREYARKWRAENPDKVKEINNSEKNKIRQARYRAKHRQEIRKRNLEYNKRKIATDVNARLKWLLRGRIVSVIKRNKGEKAYKTIELLGCSIQECREHLEKQFDENMNWDNHGSYWEIDHIKPISSFNLTKPEEQKKAYCYKNLQPLIWIENRRKSNRIVV